ncbi:MAG: 4-phosphoerythronate dehydrogenase [Bacteroidaceae bacterium]|nr:4-phosphoerythronate dehydrogenase [Bacteroidaceae bacterium]
MPLIVIDDKIPYIKGQAERLGTTRYLPGAAIAREDVREADVLIVRTRTRCDRALLEGSRVRLVVTATIGYDHLDTAYLDRAGIAWANCPGCNASSVAQYVESALILLAEAGHINLGASTVGVVGVGHVGSLVAARAAALGMSVLRCDPPRQRNEGGYFVSLARLQQEADVVTFHTPLTTAGPDATFHLAGQAFFEGLKRRPVFINTSRGEVADTAALVRAIDSGQVRQAVIDTWEDEPRISQALLQRAFLATPHIAGYSADGKANATRMALETAARFLGRSDVAFHIAPPALGIPADEIPAAPFARKLRLYDPRRDDAPLRARPADFERLRAEYPLRRERY